MSANVDLCAQRKYIRLFMRPIFSRRIRSGEPLAIRRIAMRENAGMDMLMMREEWQKLGHPAPN